MIKEVQKTEILDLDDIGNDSEINKKNKSQEVEVEKKI